MTSPTLRDQSAPTEARQSQQLVVTRRLLTRTATHAMHAPKAPDSPMRLKTTQQTVALRDTHSVDSTSDRAMRKQFSPTCKPGSYSISGTEPAMSYAWSYRCR